MPRRRVPPPELIEFTADHLNRVLSVMADLRRDRNGWINLQPALDPDEVPAPAPTLIRVFSARGPHVPFASWVLGERRRDGTAKPVSLGLQHGAGPKAGLQLRERGHPLPKGWRVLSDSPRRGLVVSVPDDVPDRETLSWLLAAASLLTEIALPAGWHAAVTRTGASS